ncbi:3'-5' exonuclease KapD [Peribacillus psychrosaccharolyticus]|uniref:3'-5' exonuclease KapD n=1 Tax=Peribacillus psychrosaccharolyticus TaxID=1407 RepID=A0A974NK54_PERPY|nr:3'-5' exonuclease KapD [Peribacillus psychrosaccharolyticus]MEC2055683.1 3'-5' exonuclease KapD [Peribacillus psychrosaccharolyticus]MED3743290.1 3'-5' exonuclease KapD [Peribacillus psychrosaccharolyticus]QQS99341.1 3'-5' exonuclease KapD [Peribacillus psychrosaccharolyticus]
MEEKQYLFIDFEFTMPEGKANPIGFYPEIIEVGFAAVKDGHITGEFSSFVTPTRFNKLTDRCKKFLHINQSQTDLGMPFAELVSLLKSYDEKLPTTVVTWGNMDMKVLRNNCQKAGLDFPFTGKQLDLSLEYKRFFGDQNQTGLWKAVQAYGKEGTGKHHRALDDALTTYNIFKLVEKDKSYMKNHQPTTIGDRIDLSKVLDQLVL